MAQKSVYLCDRCGEDMEAADPSGMIFYMVCGRRENTEEPIASEHVNPLVEAMSTLPVSRIELCERCVIETMSAAPQLVDAITETALQRAGTDRERDDLRPRVEAVRSRARAFRDTVRERLNAAAAERGALATE